MRNKSFIFEAALLVLSSSLCLSCGIDNAFSQGDFLSKGSSSSIATASPWEGRWRYVEHKRVVGDLKIENCSHEKCFFRMSTIHGMHTCDAEGEITLNGNTASYLSVFYLDEEDDKNILKISMVLNEEVGVINISANDNAQINKANCMVSYQNVLSNANKPDLLNSLEMQKTTVDALKAIGEAPISDYTDEWARVKIPDYNTDFDTTMIEIYVTKNIISVNEVVAFNIISSVEIIEDIWHFGDNTNAYGDNILKSYKQAGEYKVIYKAKVQVENPHYKSDSENTKTQENRDVSHSLNMTETNAATQDISHSQDVSNKDVSTSSQHDTKDQDVRSRHSEALAEESNNKDVSAMPQHDENSSHSEGAIATEESKIESNHDSSHSEGVKTTEESNKDTSQDVSHTDVSGLKALNMTDRGNMTQEDMTQNQQQNKTKHDNTESTINTKDKFVIKEYTRTLEILVK